MNIIWKIYTGACVIFGIMFLVGDKFDKLSCVVIPVIFWHLLNHIEAGTHPPLPVFVGESIVCLTFIIAQIIKWQGRLDGMY